MFKWLLLLTQALEIFSLVFMAWLSKEPSRFWKSGHHILLGGRRRLIVWLKAFALFFFFLIDINHSLSLGIVPQTFGIKLLTSTFWNKELNYCLLTLCQQPLERKEFVWIVHPYDIYINWISSNSYTWTIKIETHVHRQMGHSQHPSVKIPLDTKIPLSSQVGLLTPIGSYTCSRKSCSQWVWSVL